MVVFKVRGDGFES